MIRSLIAGMAFAVALASVGLAQAQTQTLPSTQILAPPPFEIRPALPDSMPTWSHDPLSGTAEHNIAATPGCGAANPQGGIPSMWSGNCP
jgi:hypothetical protein